MSSVGDVFVLDLVGLGWALGSEVEWRARTDNSFSFVASGADEWNLKHVFRLFTLRMV